MKIKEICEFGLIDRITKKPKNKDIVVGIGDDAAVVKTKKGLQVLTTDTLVEEDHFRRSWFTPKQIGMKAIEINVSDVAAMGAIPKYVLVSLALPKDLDVEFVDGMYDGMWKTCKKYNIEIVGGNVAHSKQIVITITIIGRVDKANLCLRNNARFGDFILVSGHLGNGKAGLRVFQKNLKDFEKVKKSYLEPKAKLKQALEVAYYVNSMEDISDGLASELKHICEQSKCGAIIYKDKIPIEDNVRKVAKTLGDDEYAYALYGGEDFELVYTVSKNNLKKVKGYLVGEITKDRKVKIFSLGKTKDLTKHGYDHFLNGI